MASMATEQSNSGADNRYPSRKKTRYLAVPVHLYQAVEAYAKEHSRQDDEKSISWAARQLLRKALTDLGKPIPPPPPAGSG